MKFSRFIIAAFVFILFVTIVSSIQHAYDNRDGPCIRTSLSSAPEYGKTRRRLKSSFPTYRYLSKRYMRYTLYYHGNYENSGKKCMYPVRVTKKEYEHQMGECPKPKRYGTVRCLPK